MGRITANITRTAGNVFVSVQPPETVSQIHQSERFYQDWVDVSKAIASDTESTPENRKTAEELLAEYLPHHIRASRWGFYIINSDKNRVFDGVTFVYHNPQPVFWNLYELAKGIFRDLGIRLAKSNGTWEAHIPIACLTDKVFVDSGLAGVEQTIRRRKTDDQSTASKISDSIRHRQFSETARGIAKVKQMRAEVQ